MGKMQKITCMLWYEEPVVTFGPSTPLSRCLTSEETCGHHCGSISSSIAHGFLCSPVRVQLESTECLKVISGDFRLDIPHSDLKEQNVLSSKIVLNVLMAKAAEIH